MDAFLHPDRRSLDRDRLVSLARLRHLLATSSDRRLRRHPAVIGLLKAGYNSLEDRNAHGEWSSGGDAANGQAAPPSGNQGANGGRATGGGIDTPGDDQGAGSYDTAGLTEVSPPPEDFPGYTVEFLLRLLRDPRTPKALYHIGGGFIIAVGSQALAAAGEAGTLGVATPVAVPLSLGGAAVGGAAIGTGLSELNDAAHDAGVAAARSAARPRRDRQPDVAPPPPLAVPPQQAPGRDPKPQPNPIPQPEGHDQPEKCPPPTPEALGSRTEREIYYQSQINGLPPGRDVRLGKVKFDGCDETLHRFLEAKSTTFLWGLDRPKEWLRTKHGDYMDIMGQAERQSVAAAAIGWGVDWHFADKAVADYYRKEFRTAGFSNINVYWTPYRGRP